MSTTSAITRTGTGFGAAVAAPLVFLVAYLAVGPVAGAFADGALPLPGAPAAEVAAWYAANPVPVGITAVLQVLSVAGLSVFVGAVAPALRAAGASTVAWLGHVSTVAMVVSSALSVTLAALVGMVGDPTVDLVRQASFYAGGVVCVVTLGGFVLGSALVLGRDRLFGAPTRWFGVVAGAIAVASVASLVAYYASVALPVGRVLCMVWAVVAGVVVWRRVRAES